MSYWINGNRRPMIGGNWSSGTGAGLFALTHEGLYHAEWPIYCALVLPRIKSEYPAYIPKRWIHLAKYARKARTRKKWQHAIARKIRQHEKTKGAKT